MAASRPLAWNIVQGKFVSLVLNKFQKDLYTFWIYLKIPEHVIYPTSCKTAIFL